MTCQQVTSASIRQACHSLVQHVGNLLEGGTGYPSNLGFFSFVRFVTGSTLISWIKLECSTYRSLAPHAVLEYYSTRDVNVVYRYESAGECLFGRGKACSDSWGLLCCCSNASAPQWLNKLPCVAQSLCRWLSVWKKQARQWQLGLNRGIDSWARANRLE